MKQQAEKILNESKIYSLSQLKVSQVDDELHITGSVPLWYHKQLAQEHLKQLGLRLVNKVEVL